jgi:hypothetical protein
VTGHAARRRPLWLAWLTAAGTWRSLARRGDHTGDVADPARHETGRAAASGCRRPRRARPRHAASWPASLVGGRPGDEKAPPGRPAAGRPRCPQPGARRHAASQSRPPSKPASRRRLETAARCYVAVSIAAAVTIVVLAVTGRASPAYAGPTLVWALLGAGYGILFLRRPS